MRRNLLAGYLFAAGATLSFAGGQVLARGVVREVTTPLATAVFSILFGAFFFFLFVIPRLGEEIRAANSPRGLMFFAAAGMAGALGVTAMYSALRYSPVAVVSSVSAVHPLFALLWARLFLKHLERVTPRIWLGTSLVVAGVVMVTLSQVS